VVAETGIIALSGDCFTFCASPIVFKRGVSFLQHMFDAQFARLWQKFGRKREAGFALVLFIFLSLTGH
jgi:hypothetical protein